LSNLRLQKPFGAAQFIRSDEGKHKNVKENNCITKWVFGVSNVRSTNKKLVTVFVNVSAYRQSYDFSILTNERVEI